LGSPLIEALDRLVTPELRAGASAALGEPEDAVARGLRAAFPALLAPLADRSADTVAMQRLAALARDPALDSGLLASPARALDAVSRGGAGVAGLAAALLALALGERANVTASALARHAKLASGNDASALLALAAPLVLALVRERSEREGLGTAGLGRWLASQREALRGALPPGLERAAASARPAPTAPPPPAARRPTWWIPVLLLVGLGVLWALVRAERGVEPGEPPAVAAPPPGAGAAP
jgi:hypothetical protein